MEAASVWLYEFEGNDLFRQEGIPTPDYAIAASPQEARQRAEEMGLPVVVKAQVLAGGRGLAGGVKVADSLDQAEAAAREILGLTIKGLPVDRVMVTRKIAVAQEYYLGITVDGYSGTPIAILGTNGGVHVEKAAQESPEGVVSKKIPIIAGLSLSEAKQITREAGLDGDDLEQVAGILHTLYGIFQKYDALTTEINPLTKTADGKYLALDAKVELDDDSLYRHPEFQMRPEDRMENALEQKGQRIGVTYVELDGDIALIASGAGLGMATMGVISQKMKPANFLETGGGITAELLYKVMDLVLGKKGVRALFVNLYGGVNPMHEGAKGIVRYIKEQNVTIPVVAKAIGNRQEETWEILREGGVTVVDEVATEKGVEQLFRLLEGEA
ncbi:ATP-grasp domain-containing protein [Chloroflexota bacterium]